MIPLVKFNGLIWVAYPKGSSKRYSCDINRNQMWNMLSKFDLRPITQISIDDDWTALRYRPVSLIKSVKHI